MTYCSSCKTNYGTRMAYSLHRQDGRCLSRAELSASGLFDLSYPVVRLTDTTSRLTDERPDGPAVGPTGLPE